MLKLFAVLLGGRAQGCNTELHDVVFVVGPNLKATYPSLVNKWFGLTKGLHIDSHIELRYVDGHEISLQPTKSTNKKKIFYVNFGGYRKDFFGEVHESYFYVATSKIEALARAKKDLDESLIEAHCDDNLNIDDTINITEVDGYYIHLKPTRVASRLKIVCKYRKLDNFNLSNSEAISV